MCGHILTVLSVTFSDWQPADKADSDVSKNSPLLPGQQLPDASFGKESSQVCGHW